MARMVYVDVLAWFDKEGIITPVAIRWDLRQYNITRVFDTINWVMSSGEIGTRYTVGIGRNVRYLYFDDGLWWVEV